jgi:hypothetical protein
VSDFVEGILLDANDARQTSHNSPIWLFGIDISDAFRQVPFDNIEKALRSFMHQHEVLGLPLPRVRQRVRANSMGQVRNNFGTIDSVHSRRPLPHADIRRRPRLLLPRDNQRSRNAVYVSPPAGHSPWLPARMAQSRRGKEHNMDRRHNHRSPNQRGSFFPTRQMPGISNEDRLNPPQSGHRNQGTQVLSGFP